MTLTFDDVPNGISRSLSMIQDEVGILETTHVGPTSSCSTAIGNGSTADGGELRGLGQFEVLLGQR